jgi:hypothetical protein
LRLRGKTPAETFRDPQRVNFVRNNISLIKHNNFSIKKNRNCGFLKQLVVKRFKPSPKHVPKTNRSTYECSHCPQQNLDRVSLIDHYQSEHKDNSWGVCPICKVMPWSDPEYERHVYKHLRRRHKFDFDQLVDFDHDEEYMLNQAILSSMQQQNSSGNTTAQDDGGLNISGNSISLSIIRE